MRTVHDSAPRRRPLGRARAWFHDATRAQDRAPSPPTLEAFFGETSWAYACMGRPSDGTPEAR